jgi:hypothetical protein
MLTQCSCAYTLYHFMFYCNNTEADASSSRHYCGLMGKAQCEVSRQVFARSA